MDTILPERIDVRDYGFECSYKECKNKAVRAWKQDPREYLPTYSVEYPAYAVIPHQGYIVFDFDVLKKDGKPVEGSTGFELIQKEIGEYGTDNFPHTFGVSTPSGGVHLYYKIPYNYDKHIKNAVHRDGTLTDIRANGNGVVIGNGSIINNGVYTIFDKSQVAVLSPDLVNWLEKHEYVELVTSYPPSFYRRYSHTPNMSIIPEGRRNDELSRWAYGALRFQKLNKTSEEEIYDLLIERGTACGLSVNELESIWRSALNAAHRDGIEEPIKQPAENNLLHHRHKENKTEERFIISKRASDVKNVKPVFLDNPLFPCGVLSIVTGRSGVGKSTLLLHKVAKATRGRLNGDYNGKPINVAILAAEDSFSMQKARLSVCETDLTRVHFISVGYNSSGENVETTLILPDDVPLLEGFITSNNIELLIIDPLASYMQGDTNKKDVVRKTLDPLAHMVQKLDITAVGVEHQNKGNGVARDRLSGSHAYSDIARSVIAVDRDDKTGVCYMSLVKSNYVDYIGANWEFQLTTQDVRDASGDMFSVTCVDALMPSMRTVDQVHADNNSIDSEQNREKQEITNEALKFIVDTLESEETHSLPAGEITKLGKQEGFTEKQLKNARARSRGKNKVESRWQVEGAQKWRVWYLPIPAQGTLECSDDTQVYPNSSHMVSPTSPMSPISISNASDTFSDVSPMSPTSETNVIELMKIYEYASATPWNTLTENQLVEFTSKGGLWAVKANEELSSRSQTKQVENKESSPLSTHMESRGKEKTSE